MENNKQNATLFVYQWIDENVVPDDTGKLSDMLIAYGNELNKPDVMLSLPICIDLYKNAKKLNFTDYISFCKKRLLGNEA